LSQAYIAVIEVSIYTIMLQRLGYFEIAKI
jgi:hypothetical protein